MDRVGKVEVQRRLHSNSLDSGRQREIIGVQNNTVGEQCKFFRVTWRGLLNVDMAVVVAHKFIIELPFTVACTSMQASASQHNLKASRMEQFMFLTLLESLLLLSLHCSQIT